MNIKSKMRSFVLVLSLIATAGCSSMQPQDFSAVMPRFSPEQYFLGDTKGQGVFYGRSDNVELRFTALFHGEWDGKAVTLHEDINYDSGKKENRTYTFTKISENKYYLTCGECVGKGTLESFGNTLKWTYSIKQKIDDSVWTFDLENWMFLQQDGLVLTREYVKKFGLRVGQVFMGIQKKD